MCFFSSEWSPWIDLISLSVHTSMCVCVSTSPTWFQSAFFGQKRGRGVKFTMESPGLPRFSTKTSAATVLKRWMFIPMGKNHGKTWWFHPSPVIWFAKHDGKMMPFWKTYPKRSFRPCHRRFNLEKAISIRFQKTSGSRRFQLLGCSWCPGLPGFDMDRWKLAGDACLAVPTQHVDVSFGGVHLFHVLLVISGSYPFKVINNG